MVFEMGSCSSSMNVNENAVVEGTNNPATERKLSALVVDDDPMIRKINKAILRKLGMEIQMAANGQQALHLHHLGASYNIIFMDMEMQVMDGPQTTRELRAMGVESMIVGVTSHHIDTETEVFKAAGLNYCLAKPLTIENVIPLIAELNGNN